eukprot:3232584-Amphidinium_carterae.2
MLHGSSPSSRTTLSWCLTWGSVWACPSWTSSTWGTCSSLLIEGSRVSCHPNRAACALMVLLESKSSADARATESRKVEVRRRDDSLVQEMYQCLADVKPIHRNKAESLKLLRGSITIATWKAWVTSNVPTLHTKSVGGCSGRSSATPLQGVLSAPLKYKRVSWNTELSWKVRWRTALRVLVQIMMDTQTSH